MEKNSQYTERTNKPNGKEIDAEEACAYRSPIGEFVVYQRAWDIPSEEYTSKKSDDREEYLSRHKVEDVEYRHASYPQEIYSA